MMEKTKRVLVYHDTETLASRTRRPLTGETVGYRSIDQWDEKLNATFDEVINLSTKKPLTKVKKETE